MNTMMAAIRRTLTSLPVTAILLAAILLSCPPRVSCADDTEEGDDAPNLNITITCASDDVTDANWQESCTYVKSPLGSALELACHVQRDYNVGWISWLHANGTQIESQPLNDTGMSTSSANNTATLVIEQLHSSDAGNFTCVTSDARLRAVIQVEAYEIPNYFWEGVIILSINGFLVIMFFICMIRSVIANKKSLKHIASFNKHDYGKADAKNFI